MAGFLNWLKGSKKTAEKQNTTEEKFEAGQLWNYKTRPGEENSRLTILKIETYEAQGVVIHIALNGLRITNPHAFTLLHSCKQQDKTTTQASETEMHESTFEKLSKTWAYVSDNMYSFGSLNLKADSTFLYEFGGCLGTTYSAGKWTLQGDMIVLNSYEKYAPKPVELSIPVAEVQQEISEETRAPADTTAPAKTFKTFTLTYVPPKDVSAPVTIGDFLPDSSFTFLKDRVLIFEQDTLYELNGFMGSRSGTKYRAIKNEDL